MKWLKEEDSDLWFVKDDLHTESTGQSTHQYSVKQSFLQHIFLHTFCLRRILFTKKSCPQRILCHQKTLAVGHLISVFCLVHKFIGINCIDSRFSVLIEMFVTTISFFAWDLGMTSESMEAWSQKNVRNLPGTNAHVFFSQTGFQNQYIANDSISNTQWSQQHNL